MKYIVILVSIFFLLLSCTEDKIKEKNKFEFIYNQEVNNLEKKKINNLEKKIDIEKKKILEKKELEDKYYKTITVLQYYEYINNWELEKAYNLKYDPQISYNEFIWLYKDVKNICRIYKFYDSCTTVERAKKNQLLLNTDLFLVKVDGEIYNVKMELLKIKWKYLIWWSKSELNLNQTYESSIDLHNENLPEDIKNKYIEFLKKIKWIKEERNYIWNEENHKNYLGLIEKELNNYKDLFIYLYENDLLLKDLKESIEWNFTKFSSYDKKIEYDIFHYKKEDYYVWKPFFIIKEWNSYTFKIVPYWTGISDLSSFSSIKFNNILYWSWWWGWCWWFNNNILFDSNFNYINSIYSNNWFCSGHSEEDYVSWKLKIIFHRLNRSLNLYSLISPYNEYIVYLNKNNEEVFNINENLLNWKKFNIKINGKKYEYNEENIVWTGSLYDWPVKNSFVMWLKKYYNWSYKILWETFSYKKNITKIEVYSCKENFSKEYDTEPYILESFDSTKKEFDYGISEKYWNYCDIPYKFRLYNEEWKYSEIPVTVIYD